jgi:hypothetical protein
MRPYAAGMHLSPDWVVLGTESGREDDGFRYMVMASSTLTRAEVEAEMDHIRAYDDWGYADRWIQGPTSYLLTVQMGSIVVVFGDSYQECFTRLFRDWAPDEKSAAGAIGPMPKEIGSAP